MTEKATENTTEESSASQDSGPQAAMTEGDLTSTVEFSEATETPSQESAETTEETSEEKSETTEESGDETTDEEAQAFTKEELARLDATFQDSPRFKQMQNIVTDLRDRLVKAETKTEMLEKQVGEKTTTKDDDSEDQKMSYTDIMELSEDEISSQFDKNPKAFLANFGRQIYSEIMAEVQQTQQLRDREAKQKTAEERIQDRYKKYEKDNPDFKEMWESGEIQTYMDDNPGETPISAHRALTEESRIKSAVDDAVKTAVKDTEKKVKTKKSAKVIGGGPADAAQRAQNQVPEELTNTKKFGGLAQVLTRRSLARVK